MPKTKSQGLEYLSPDSVERNPENPRIEFDEKLMQDLLESINEVGILVPLIVYYDDVREKYVLLDGERRLRCARMIKMKSIPANIVAKPTRLQNILEMFNIHNVRIEWGPMEIAWKIKVIIEEFGYVKDKELSRLTSLKMSEVRKSKILLSFSRKFQNLVHKGQKNGGIKEDFLVELKPVLNWIEQNLSFSKKDLDRFITVLIRKHKKGIIDNYVRSFRNLNKIIKAKMPIEKIANIINKLLKQSNYSIEDAYETSIKYTINLKDIERRAEKLTTYLSDLKFEAHSKENKNLINTLKELDAVIREIIKRLS